MGKNVTGVAQVVMFMHRPDSSLLSRCRRRARDQGALSPDNQG